MTPESFSQPPTLAELARRLDRIEAAWDARVVTLDVYNAEKTAHTVEVAAMNHRLSQVEDSIQSATRLLIAAFLGIIGQAVFLALTLFGK